MPGLRKMLGFMDVVEVHPPAGIFAGPDANNNVGDPPNRIVRWMQLINLGHRIPGVVNTDAHYNVHGSGWLRNWFESKSDDPAKIDIADMIHSAEHGHIIMSTGPFLEVVAESQHQGEEEKRGPGDDIIADKGDVELKIKVQCPNWFDIDRVQIFVNGRAVEDLNYTRGKDPERFDAGTVKFEEEIRLSLDADAHIIVGAIGEKSTLGPVMEKRLANCNRWPFPIPFLWMSTVTDLPRIAMIWGLDCSMRKRKVLPKAQSKSLAK